MRGKRDRRTGEIIEVASQPLKQPDLGGRPAGRSGRGAARPTEPVTGPLPQVPRPRDARGQAEASTVPEPAMRRSQPARGPAESTFDGKTEPLKSPRGRRARESEEPKTRPYRPGSNPTMPAVEASGLGDPMQDPLSGWLVVVRGPGKGRFCRLGYGVNTLGRGENSRVRLDFGDEDISREVHATLTYDPKGRRYYLQHGGGIQLTYLDDEPVLAPTPLDGFRHIVLGRTTLRFVPLCGPEFDWQDLD